MAYSKYENPKSKQYANGPRTVQVAMSAKPELTPKQQQQLTKAQAKVKETRTRYNETKSEEDFMDNTKAGDELQILERKLYGPSFQEKVLQKIFFKNK